MKYNINSLRAFFGNLIEPIFASQFISIISYNYRDRRYIYRLCDDIKKEKNALAKHHEMYQIYQLVRSTNKLSGDLAEVGVYKGTTAKIILEARINKKLHLFDTYEGLPKPEKIDVQFHEGQYNASLESVQNYLKKYKNVFYHKGLFPGTGKAVRNKKFSFVHLDVDLYQGTKDSLEFFYPRMVKGGIIISHDYVSNGIKKAFTDFFKNKPEPIIELPGIQCMIVKV